MEEQEDFNSTDSSAQYVLNWQVAVLALDQFIKDNITEEHYQYIMTNIIQQRSLDQCLRILTVTRPILSPEFNRQIEALIHNIGRVRYRLSHPDEFTIAQIEIMRTVYATDLTTLKNATSQVIIAIIE